MSDFGPIWQAAEARVGGPDALADRLTRPKSEAELRAVADDRYLSLMTRRIFQAGLKHSLVDAKWPVFEEAFFGFDPGRCAALRDEDLDARLADKRLIRHGGKMVAIRHNATALLAVAGIEGGMGAWLAAWPSSRIVELWDELGRRFSNLGGNSAPYFLRMAGKDTFLLTDSVVRALIHWGALEGPPKTKAERANVQELFNRWQAATGRPFCQLSQTLALSTE